MTFAGLVFKEGRFVAKGQYCSLQAAAGRHLPAVEPHHQTGLARRRRGPGGGTARPIASPGYGCLRPRTGRSLKLRCDEGGHRGAAASFLCVRVALCMCHCCCWLCWGGVLAARIGVALLFTAVLNKKKGQI